MMNTVICMIGGTEILLIGAAVLLLFGGKKIPEMMKGMGKGVKSFKEGMSEPSEEEIARRVDEEVRRRADERMAADENGTAVPSEATSSGETQQPKETQGE